MKFVFSFVLFFFLLVVIFFGFVEYDGGEWCFVEDFVWKRRFRCVLCVVDVMDCV